MNWFKLAYTLILQKKFINFNTCINTANKLSISLHVKQEHGLSTGHWKKTLLESSVPRTVEKPSLVLSLAQATFTCTFDYQLGTFGDKVLALKFRCCQGQLTSFSLVTIYTTVRHLARAYNFARFAANDVKERQETEPVARDNNTIFTLNHGDRTFVVSYSTDDRSNVFRCLLSACWN